MAAVRRDGDDLLLQLYLQPRASRDAIIGLHGDALKVAITAPPVDGAANAHLIACFAKWCKVNKSAVVLEAGDSSRHKRLRIHAPQQLPAALAELLASPAC